MANTKPCKKCSNMIDKKAKTCPYCGQKQGSKAAGCAATFLVVILLFIILLIAIPTSDTEPTTQVPSEPSDVTSSEAASSQQLTQSEIEALAKVKQEAAEAESRRENNIYLVGETMTTDRISLSMTKVEDYDPDNEFITPDEGNKFIKVYFVAENVGDTDLIISSFSFNCYVDDTAINESWSSSDKAFPSSTLSSGRKAEGYIYYEVPEDAEHIEIEYETSYWTQKKATFIVK